MVDARRTTSRGTSAALVLGSVATVIAVFVSVLETVFKDLGPVVLLLPPLWFCVDPPTYVTFWPSDAFPIAVLACFLAGPLSLLLHLILFWREDRNVRAATGEPVTA